MRAFKDALARLHVLFTRRATAVQELAATQVSNPATYDENREFLTKAVQHWDGRINAAVEELTQYPPHLSEFFANVESFQRIAPYDSSVFIMTAYPAGNNPEKDTELQQVIDALCDSLRESGLCPRLGKNGIHHDWIWGNTVVGMLGSRYGIAILEDRYRDELNPNVAMELGWMLALKRDVLVLKEKAFKHNRADWLGRIVAEFRWDKVQEDIPTAIRDWLQPPERR